MPDTMTTWQSFAPAISEIYLVAAICLILLVDAFAGRDDPAPGPRDEPGAMLASGQVWEWTQSAFAGYPGFRAHPYREYSEVFFGDAYRVLRGGSWATAPRVASVTFRNWDLPQRRQIFAGVRLARDLS